MGKRVVVLGAGVTGEAFVSALRRLDAEAEITVVEHQREIGTGRVGVLADHERAGPGTGRPVHPT